ncbi:MAG: hypothetical protein ABIH82_02955 [Candidatus Woesearchaeota archaeon]
MTKLIEMVCTGNQGRSPVAELVANNYIREIGLQDEYQVISSGTMVDKIEAGDVSQGFMKHVVGIAQDRNDIYTPQQIAELDSALRAGNTEVLRRYFNKASDKFVKEERSDRKYVLPQLGIEGKVKHVQEQTVVRPDTVAVLSMAKSNDAQVRDLYADSSFSPVIDVLSKYATGVEGAEVPNAFGKGTETYVKAIITIKEQVPMAIDKVIENDRRTA